MGRTKGTAATAGLVTAVGTLVTLFTIGCGAADAGLSSPTNPSNPSNPSGPTTQPCTDVAAPSAPAAAPLWYPVNPTGSPPVERWYHASAYDAASDKLIVFGGLTNNSQLLNDVWVLSNATTMNGPAQWTQLQPTGTAPAARRGAMAGYDPSTNRLIVYGGLDASRYYADLWILSNANGTGGTPAWTQVTIPSPPTAHGLSSGAYDSRTNRFVIFGGLNCFTTFCTPTNEAWVISNANGNGTVAATKLSITGTAPSGRFSASTAYDPTGDRLIVFGGNPSTSYASDPSSAVNETWVLNGTNPAVSHTWTRMTTTNAPNARYTHSAAWDDARQRMFVFGGDGSDNFVRNDIWQLTGISASGSTGTWSIIATGLPVPEARSVSIAQYSASLDRLVVFAGDVGNQKLTNNVWALRGTPPAVAKVTVNGNATSVCANNRLKLVAVPTDATGAVVNASITWTSNDPSTLDVDDNGVVTGINPGSGSVVACVGNVCSQPYNVQIRQSAQPSQPTTPTGGGSTLRISTQFVNGIDACIDANAGKTSEFDVITAMAEGGSPQSGYTWTIAPGSTFPSGITVDALTGILHKTSAAATLVKGPSTFTMQVSDGSSTATASFTYNTTNSTSAPDPDGTPNPGCGVGIMEQATVNLVTLVGGKSGRSYGASLFVSPGSDTPQGLADRNLQWHLATGALPPGLTIDLTRGIVRGTPSATGTFDFTIRVTNGSGQTAHGTPTYRIVVSP